MSTLQPFQFYPEVLSLPLQAVLLLAIASSSCLSSEAISLDISLNCLVSSSASANLFLSCSKSLSISESLLLRDSCSVLSSERSFSIETSSFARCSFLSPKPEGSIFCPQTGQIPFSINSSVVFFCSCIRDLFLINSVSPSVTFPNLSSSSSEVCSDGGFINLNSSISFSFAAISCSTFCIFFWVLSISSSSLLIALFNSGILPAISCTLPFSFCISFCLARSP